MDRKNTVLSLRRTLLYKALSPLTNYSKEIWTTGLSCLSLFIDMFMHCQDTVDVSKASNIQYIKGCQMLHIWDMDIISMI